MNNNKFCFIVCSNDEAYMEECKSYIQLLEVPCGYEIELLTIAEATSMASGYNEGMHTSDAKYKIYLHHDVFIINSKMLFDVLELFTDPTIGMIGMIGAPKLPESGVMWYAPRVGRIYANSIVMAGEGVMNENQQKTVEVEAIDGLMMITQYDIPWREDLFDGWDFYDASQSQEFIRAGYKVVVPAMKTSWCLHDDGFMNLENYYRSRKIFQKEYIYNLKKKK